MRDYAALLAEDTYAIFLLHGVIPAPRPGLRNYTSKHITADRFGAVLDGLLARGAPVSLPDIVRAETGGAPLPPRAFAVTFDDGFENNASVAAPILRERGVPAAFYVTTSFVGADGCSWIDLIEQAVEAVGSFELELPFTGPPARYETREEKIALLDGIRRFVKSEPTVDAYELAANVRSQLAIGSLEPDPDLDRKLDWDQVRRLDGEDLFTVGGHGHTHRILEFLDDRELSDEVERSLATLTAELGSPVEHYSYPEGLANCYSQRVIDLLRANGIVCAPTAEPGINRAGADLFRLRRLTVV